MKRLLLIALLFLFTACGELQAGAPADLTGTEGLKLTIGSYPTEVFMGQSASIPVTIENKGLTAVDGGILSISGYDSRHLQFRSTRFDDIKLAGRGPFIPVGERTTRTFTITSIKLPDAKQKVETPQITACYKYRTEATPVVCINPSLRLGDQAIKSGCDFQTAQLTASQGAPLAVTRVETEYFSDGEEVEFKIYIDDVSGSGTVIASESYAKYCGESQPVVSKELNAVDVEAYLSGQTIPCFTVEHEEPVNRIILTKSGPDVICGARIDPTKSGYTTPMSIYLSYGYSEAKVLSMTLKNPSFVGSK